MNYSDFVTSCFAELQSKQEELYKNYDLDSYPRWFYDQAAGLLTFSDEESQRELNFRYYAVGSYSKKSKTWKWSWDNDHTLKKVKLELCKVKQFGEQQGFERLTEGLFDSYEEEGWEFAAIASKLLNGIGSYRPDSDGLLIFMVLYEIVENEIAQEEKEKYVNCEEHERRRRAFICQHLKKNSKNGFEEAFETYEDMEFLYEDDDFQAWCNECEKVRVATDGWNDESMEFAKIQLVCEKCYFAIKATNTSLN